MALSPEQVARYHRDGFILVESVFSLDEVAAMKVEIRRILEQRRKEKPGTATNGVYVGLTIASTLFRQVNADPRVVDVLEQIIGPNLEFWSDKVVFKSADVDFSSPWHQDWQYWKGANKWSVWIALDDATPENGCLKLLPGTHRSVIAHNGKDKDGIGFSNRLDENAVDESQAVVVPVRAGGAVFFHDLALHASLPNTSGRDRWAVISTYRDASADDLEYTFARGAFMVRGERTGKVLQEAGTA